MCEIAIVVYCIDHTFFNIVVVQAWIVLLGVFKFGYHIVMVATKDSASFLHSPQEGSMEIGHSDGNFLRLDLIFRRLVHENT